MVCSQPLVFDRRGPLTIDIRNSEIGNPTLFGCIRSGLKRGTVFAPLPLRKDVQNRRWHWVQRESRVNQGWDAAHGSAWQGVTKASQDPVPAAGASEWTKPSSFLAANFRPWSQHTPCLAVAQVLFLQLGCTDELACAPAEPCRLCFSRAKAMFVSQRNRVEWSLSGPRLGRAEDEMSPELMGSQIGTTIR